MSAQNIYIYTLISAPTVHFPLGGVNVKMKILIPINHMRIILLAPLEGKSVEEFFKNKKLQLSQNSGKGKIPLSYVLNGSLYKREFVKKNLSLNISP